MATLSCITDKFAAGNFGSDSGHVLRSTVLVPFPLTLYFSAVIVSTSFVRAVKA